MIELPLNIPMDWLITALIVLAAILLVVLVIKIFIILLPAIIIAGIVWLITYDKLMTAVAFLIITIIGLIKKL